MDGIFFLLLAFCTIYMSIKLSYYGDVLSKQSKVGAAFIGGLLIASITSLPEFVTSVSAVVLDNASLSFGDIVGSNMFNILFVLGTAATISPIPLQMDSLVIDALTFFLMTIILVLHAKGGKKYELGRGEGFCLLAIYVMYAIYVIVRG